MFNLFTSFSVISEQSSALPKLYLYTSVYYAIFTTLHPHPLLLSFPKKTTSLQCIDQRPLVPEDISKEPYLHLLNLSKQLAHPFVVCKVCPQLEQV